MNAIDLETKEQLDQLRNTNDLAVIFKHNTSCPISKMARANFERDAGALPEGTPIYILDLLSNREISDSIATEFGVEHESPQILVIKDGKCFFHQSLYDISAEDAAIAISEN